MGIINRSASHFLYLKLNSDIRLQMKFLRERQFDSKENIFKLQRERLNNLLTHAIQNVPYYKEKFQGTTLGKENERNIFRQFEQLPLLDRECLEDNFEQLTSCDITSKKIYINKSGGSTGRPVRFIQDSDYQSWNISVPLLFDEWSGRKVGDRRIRLWGSERDLMIGKESFKTSLARKIRNELFLNAFQMSKSQMYEYVNQINNFKPQQILAYANGIYELAKFIEENSLIVFSPKSVVTSAGTLYSHMRETIERVFRCSVFNRYGSREVGGIACECEFKTGLHISPFTHYVEIVDEKGNMVKDGEIGHIVVTSLTNYSMPLIRYKIGDLGVMTNEICSCGRNWPTLKKVIGRSTDVFKKRDGTIILPETLIHFVGVTLYSNLITRFKIIQTSYEEVTILIQNNKTSNSQKELKLLFNKITQNIKIIMGEEVLVKIKSVDKIEDSHSGKYRYTESLFV